MEAQPKITAKTVIAVAALEGPGPKWWLVYVQEIKAKKYEGKAPDTNGRKSL